MPDSLHFLTAFLGLATVILLVIEIWTSGVASRRKGCARRSSHGPRGIQQIRQGIA